MQKPLSSLWLVELNKRVKENKIYQTAKRSDSNINLFGHILFSFILVIFVSSGLRLLEGALTKESGALSMNSALAAELSDKAALTFQSHSSINIKPNEAITATLTFKNTGTTTWTQKSVYLKSLSTALTFKHKFWPDPYLPAKLQKTSVAPGETGTFKFALQSPSKYNSYTGEFVLVNNNMMIAGGEVAITMNVVEDPSKVNQPAPAVTPEPAAPAPALNVCNLKLNIAGLTTGLDNVSCVEKFSINNQGPNIRVGIFNTENAITIKSSAAWQVYDKAEMLLASVPAEQAVTFFYIKSKGEYAFDFIDRTVRTSSDLNIKNFGRGIFSIVGYNDIPTWNKTINYNQFKGDLKVSYYAPKERVWLINTLPLEEYLKGIKETSEENPLEYQRAMTIAARTYALYHVNKFAVEASPFDVYNDERDQVYKGYVAEQIMPKQVGAVADTNGVVLTYDTGVIIAFYSARSGGQTVDSKKYPYLKSVETPYTKNKSQYGHGVGIDQQDAKARAEKLGWTYDRILKYYYSGINIEKIY